jgi:hypothetical protein
MEVLGYVGASFVALWGAAHLFPTRNVVKGFGEISTDNRRIITMEWIIEGVALIFAGVTAAATLAVSGGRQSRLVLSLIAALLVTLAGVSLFTGYRVKFLPFRLCPFIFTAGAILLLLAAWVPA